MVDRGPAARDQRGLACLGVLAERAERGVAQDDLRHLARRGQDGSLCKPPLRGLHEVGPPDRRVGAGCKTKKLVAPLLVVGDRHIEDVQDPHGPLATSALAVVAAVAMGDGTQERTHRSGRRPGRTRGVRGRLVPDRLVLGGAVRDLVEIRGEGGAGRVDRRHSFQGKPPHDQETTHVFGRVTAVGTGRVLGGPQSVPPVPRAQGRGGDAEPAGYRSHREGGALGGGLARSVGGGSGPERGHALDSATPGSDRHSSAPGGAMRNGWFARRLGRLSKSRQGFAIPHLMARFSPRLHP